MRINDFSLPAFNIRQSAQVQGFTLNNNDDLIDKILCEKKDDIKLLKDELLPDAPMNCRIYRGANGKAIAVFYGTSKDYPIDNWVFKIDNGEIVERTTLKTLKPANNYDEDAKRQLEVFAYMDVSLDMKQYPEANKADAEKYRAFFAEGISAQSVDLSKADFNNPVCEKKK